MFEDCQYLCRGYWSYGLQYPDDNEMVECYCGTKDEREALPSSPNVPLKNCHKTFGGHLALRVFTQGRNFVFLKRSYWGGGESVT